jgi:hypothetical protein
VTTLCGWIPSTFGGAFWQALGWVCAGFAFGLGVAIAGGLMSVAGELVRRSGLFA